MISKKTFFALGIALGMQGIVFEGRTSINSEDDLTSFYSKRTMEQSPQAIYVEGKNYFYGENGFVQDSIKAFACFVKAKDKGHTKSLFMVAGCYYYNCGIPLCDITKRHKKAFVYYLQAAHEGHEKSLNKLALLYLKGHGTQQSNAKALAYYLLVQAGGGQPSLPDFERFSENVRSQGDLRDTYYELGHYYTKIKNYDKAMHWYISAAQENYSLGLRAQTQPPHVSQDCKEILVYCQKTAENQDKEAQYKLGLFCDQGPIGGF